MWFGRWQLWVGEIRSRERQSQPKDWEFVRDLALIPETRRRRRQRKVEEKATKTERQKRAKEQVFWGSNHIEKEIMKKGRLEKVKLEEIELQVGKGERNFYLFFWDIVGGTISVEESGGLFFKESSRQRWGEKRRGWITKTSCTSIYWQSRPKEILTLTTIGHFLLEISHVKMLDIK